MSSRALVVCGRPVPTGPVWAADGITPDWSPEVDVEDLAVQAQAIVTDVRQLDPMLVRQVLASACVLEPTRMAQILMVLAVWVPNDEPLSARGRRADDVARGLPV